MKPSLLLVLIWGISFLGSAQSTTYYKYDSRNRLSAVTLPNCISLKYQFDHDGNRTSVQKSQILITPSITNNSCYGLSQGNITIQAQGGSSYTYQWSNNRTGAVNSNLPAGVYTVTITDAVLSNTCSQIYTISQPQPLNINVATISASCYGTNDGGAAIDTSSFSSTNLTFRWPNGSQGISTQGLSAGAYNLNVTNSTTSCSQTIPFTISQPSSFITHIDTNNISCYGANDGYIGISVAGNLSSYTFHWSDGNLGNSHGNLPPGPQIVTATNDTTGCTQTIVTDIREPTKIITSTQVTPSCVNESNGGISLSTVGGNPPYKYSFNNAAFQASNTFGLLSTGTYLVLTRDNSYCIDTINVTVASVNCATSLTNVPENEIVKVYPSPNGGEFFIEFVSNKDLKYSIEIYDNAGALVKTVSNMSVSGKEKLTIDLSSASSGIYTLKLNLDGQVIVKQVEVVK